VLQPGFYQFHASVATNARLQWCDGCEGNTPSGTVPADSELEVNLTVGGQARTDNAEGAQGSAR